MNIAMGTDHGGYPLKSTIVDMIARGGHRIIDCGASIVDPDDDYPVFAKRVALAVQLREADRGILLCGSGVGASVTANKIKGVRAAVCHDTFSAHQGVEDDDMNVLCLGARVVGPALAGELVNAFLGAKFSGAERHRRRLEMIRTIETNFDRTP